MSRLDAIKAVLCDPTKLTGSQYMALDALIKLAEDYRMVKDDERCECDEESDGPCVWCRMRDNVDSLCLEASE